MNKLKVRLIGMLTLSIFYSSCADNAVDKDIDAGNASTRQIKFSIQKSPNLVLTNLKGYLFRKGIFYKSFPNLSTDGQDKIDMNVPTGSTLYFLANIPEPAPLTAMREGVTTLDDFLSYHTPEEETHTETRAPSQFYSARVTPDLSQPEFNIPMGLSVARIDLDVSEATAVKISRIYTEQAPSTTAYFEGETTTPSVSNHTYSRVFDVPETGKVEDIFRIYEKDRPVEFILEGTHGDTPISISTVIKRIERNKIYKIRVQAAGMNVNSSIDVADWMTGDQIVAEESMNSDIQLDLEESYLPKGVELESKSVINVPSGGVTDLKLAFSSDEVTTISVEGKVGDISSPEITDKDGKTVSTYSLVLLPNELQLSTCVTLHLQSRSDGKEVSSKFTINTLPFMYTIPEVTIGKMTWMAFNSVSGKSSEQIYPENFGLSDIKSMYDNLWVNTLGNMFQYGRPTPYAPWYSDNIDPQPEVSWEDASDSPCPDGYRLPTKQELSDLIIGDGKGTLGGGYIPSAQHYRGDTVYTKIIEKNNITVNGISGKVRYLELKNQKGVTLYFPLGGMKEKGNPPAKNPGLGNGFRYWVAESAESNKAYACELIFKNEGQFTVPNTEMTVDKEAFCYVRCIKRIY